MQVQLFITCLGENFFPEMLEKMVTLLERLGVMPHFPPEQTCCGQPQYNSGFEAETRSMARRWMQTFSRKRDPIVSPSGSCVEMVRHYPHLFPEGSAEHALAVDLAARTFEFTEFLVRQLGITDVGARFPHRVTYHASCHLLRGLGLRNEAKQLLAAVRDLELIPLTEEETCCGFGGIFSVLYPEVSRAMLEDKVRHIVATGAEYVVIGEAGCLMNIAGGLQKAGSPIRPIHLIEVLAAQGGA